MSTPREPTRGPFEERKRPAAGPPGASTAPEPQQPGSPEQNGSNGSRPHDPDQPPVRPRYTVNLPRPGPPPPPPPRRVKPAWYRRPLPELPARPTLPRVGRRPLLVALAVLLLAGLGVGLGAAFSGGSGAHAGAVADPTAPPASPRPSASASSAGAPIGTAFPVVQEGRRVGTVTLLGTRAVSMTSGTPPTATPYVAFHVRFAAAGGSLYTSPLEFTVPGASDGPVLNGGAQPGVENTGVPAGKQVVAWVTIQAPRHGTLGFTSDPSLPASHSWAY